MKLKLWVFATIMQHRNMMADIECVKAMNLIDIVFFDNKEVRDAWAILHLQTLENGRNPGNPSNNILWEGKRNTLLASMATAVGMGADFRPDDFSRIHTPLGFEKDLLIRFKQQEALFKQLYPEHDSEQPKSGLA